MGDKIQYNICNGSVLKKKALAYVESIYVCVQRAYIFYLDFETVDSALWMSNSIAVQWI